MKALSELRVVDGSPRVLLRFPSAATKGAGIALASAMAEEGCFVASSRSAAWRFESISPEGELACLAGPDPFSGRAESSDPAAGPLGLDEAGTIAEGMAMLLLVARALAVLKAERKLPRGLVSSGILLDRGHEEVLVLPPSAVSRALGAQGEEGRASALARLSSPRALTPEDDASFLIAQAAYRIAAGTCPYPKEAAEQGSVAPGSRSTASLALACPRLDPRLSALVDAALDDPRKVALADWIAALEGGAGTGWIRELEAEEEKSLTSRREAFELESRVRQRRVDFFRKYRAALVAVAIAVVAVAAVWIDIARAERAKPNFAGLSAQELVARYYRAVDGLDMESLEACGDKKAIAADRDYVMNLYVVTKTRTAYEGKSPIVRAGDWLAAGRPALQPTDFLYGIADLRVEMGASASSPVPTQSARASYSLWYIEAKEDPSGDTSKTQYVPTEEKRVDELVLERTKRGWQIVSLQRMRTQ